MSIYQYKKLVYGRLTFGNRLNATTTCQEVSSKDTDEDRNANNASPPARKVTDEVDLLLAFILRPEADTADEEGPVEGTAGVWMGSGESCVVLQHQDLQFGELLEEVDRSRFFVDYLVLVLAFTVWKYGSVRDQD